jgi:hypothetical protein
VEGILCAWRYLHVVASKKIDGKDTVKNRNRTIAQTSTVFLARFLPLLEMPNVHDVFLCPEPNMFQPGRSTDN